MNAIDSSQSNGVLHAGLLVAVILFGSTLGLAQPPHSQLDGQRTVVVSGKVIDADGQPISGAVVLLTDRWRKQRRVVVAELKTNARGEFTSPELTLPRETFSVVATACAPKLAMQSQNIPINRGEAAPIEFKLVQASEATLRLVDEHQQPVKGATIESISTSGIQDSSARAERDDWERFGLPVPESDDKGVLTIPLLDPDLLYEVRIVHPDFVDVRLKDVGTSLDERKVTLPRGELVRLKVIARSDPRAVSEATVVGSVSGNGGAFRKVIQLDANGNATTRLTDRPTSIRIQHPNLFGMPPWYHYRPANGQLLKFSLHETGKLRGRVVDTQTGKGVPDISVGFVHDNQRIETTRTDANGYYEADLPTLPVAVSVTGESDGWAADKTTLTATPQAGKTQALDDLSVTSKHEITGRVLMPSGEPVSNAIVVSGSRNHVTKTDQKGFFTVPNEAGSIIRQVGIHAMHPYQRMAISVAVDPNAGPIDMTLQAEGVLLGMVVDQNGKPLADVPVDLRGTFSSGRAAITTYRAFSRQDGTFRFLGLSGGMTYQAQIRGRERANSVSTENVQGGKKTIDERADRKPLKVSPQLLKEVRELANASPSASATLVDFDCQRWVGEPVGLDQLKGKSVLLYCGQDPRQLSTLQIAHDLYGEHGLAVIGMLPAPAEMPDMLMQMVAQRAKVSFPLAFPDPSIDNKLKLRAPAFLLYGADGKLRGNQVDDPLEQVRLHLLSEMNR